MTDENSGSGTAPQKGALALDVQERRDMMPRGPGGSMQPANLGEMMEFCRILSSSGMLPPDYQNNPGNVLVAVQMGQELGLPAMQAIQNIAVIKGRPSLWGDAMLAVVRAHPKFKSIQEMDLEDITANGKAVCVLTRKGEPSHTVTFSVDDAKRAGLWGKGGPWTQYPSRMLQLRARAFACRNVFPDALRGINTIEEAGDIPDSVDAVATVKSSAPSSIVGRLRAKNADTQATEPSTVIDEPAQAEDDPSPEPDAESAPGNDAQPQNGELSAAQEQEMMDSEGGEG